MGFKPTKVEPVNLETSFMAAMADKGVAATAEILDTPNTTQTYRVQGVQTVPQ